MIGEFLLNIVFNIVKNILTNTNLGEFSWVISDGALDPFFQCVRAGLYFLPTQSIKIMLGLIIWFYIFRIAIRLIRTIWDVLPIV